MTYEKVNFNMHSVYPAMFDAGPGDSGMLNSPSSFYPAQVDGSLFQMTGVLQDNFSDTYPRLDLTMPAQVPYPLDCPMPFGAPSTSLPQVNTQVALDLAWKAVNDNFMKHLAAIDALCRTNPFVGNQRGLEYSLDVKNLNKSTNADYISELHSDMQEKVNLLESFAKSKGIPFKIIDGYRTRDEQLALQKKYAGQKGRVAGADTSLHRKGKAIDIDVSNLSESQRKQLGDYAKSIGMRWGRDFSSYPEDWHFDIG